VAINNCLFFFLCPRVVSKTKNKGVNKQTDKTNMGVPMGGQRFLYWVYTTRRTASAESI